jgi:hypothetical protein
LRLSLSLPPSLVQCRLLSYAYSMPSLGCVHIRKLILTCQCSLPCLYRFALPPMLLSLALSFAFFFFMFDGINGVLGCTDRRVAPGIRWSRAVAACVCGRTSPPYSRRRLGRRPHRPCPGAVQSAPVQPVRQSPMTRSLPHPARARPQLRHVPQSGADSDGHPAQHDPDPDAHSWRTCPDPAQPAAATARPASTLLDLEPPPAAPRTPTTASPRQPGSGRETRTRPHPHSPARASSESGVPVPLHAAC